MRKRTTIVDISIYLAIAKGVRVLLVGVLLAIGLVPSALADTFYKYTYTGNPLTSCSGPGCVTSAPFPKITGWFTIGYPLGPNLSLGAITPISYEITDGTAVLTNMNSRLTYLDIATTSGVITAWDFFVDSVNGPQIEMYTSANLPPPAVLAGEDASGDHTSTSVIVNNANFNVPGTWTVISSNVIANAGPPQTVQTGTIVTLDGSGSTDSSGLTPLTYAWSFISVAPGSTATLANATSVHPTFTVDQPGNYVVQLVVINSAGMSSTPSIVPIHAYTSSQSNVWTWGDNYYGELGIGTQIPSNAPMQISGMSNVTAISGGSGVSMALTSDGNVWTWGINQLGQLGIGTNTGPQICSTSGIYSYACSTTPVQVAGLKGVTAIAAGGYGHAMAMKSDGTVWTWGYNFAGQLGVGQDTYTGGGPQTCIIGSSSYPCSMTPVQVMTTTGTPLGNVVAIAAGAYHSMALKSDGTVWTWGLNDLGQLGIGTNTTDNNMPVQVPGLSGVVAIAAGAYHSMALTSDGTVWVWGENDYGQLGDGTANGPQTCTIGSSSVPCSMTPVQVMTTAGMPLGNVMAIAGGFYHSMALTSDGNVWTWGDNEFGQLGDGTAAGPQTCLKANTSDSYACSMTPVQVSGLSSIAAIAGGFYQSMALTSGRIVWAWGYNVSGQLGTGVNSPLYSSTPLQVIGLSNVTDIAGGGSHSMAIAGATYTITAMVINYDGSMPGNGTIAPSGTVTVPAGSNQSFTIGPNSEWILYSVIVDDFVQEGVVTNYTFTNVQAKHTIKAYVKPIPYTITATAGAGGSISPPGVNPVNPGGSMTFTITPSAGYSITDVEVGPTSGTMTSAGTSSSYTVSGVTANMTIVATFAPNPTTYNITTLLSNADNSSPPYGSISPSGDANGNVSVTAGTNQKFTISPQAGYVVSNVTVDGGLPLGPLTSYTFHAVQGPHKISVTFAAVQVTVTSATGGSVTVTGTSIPSTTLTEAAGNTFMVNPGDSVTLAIAPDNGRSIRSVIADGVNRGAVQTYSLTNIKASHTVNVYFK
jgi:alpha-tubulin suppressor-like RCC1 family protein